MNSNLRKIKNQHKEKEKGNHSRKKSPIYVNRGVYGWLIRNSIVAIIPACHAGDPSSILGCGGFYFFHQLSSPQHTSLKYLNELFLGLIAERQKEYPPSPSFKKLHISVMLFEAVKNNMLMKRLLMYKYINVRKIRIIVRFFIYWLEDDYAHQTRIKNISDDVHPGTRIINLEH